IVMENPNHLNDPNIPEGDQAPAVPDGFAPQWIGEHDPNNNNGWIEWDVPLGGEVDEPMVDPEVNEEDLSTRLGNLEYKHGVLMRKMEEVSDAEVADNITIREIHPRVATVEEQVQVMESQAMQVEQQLWTRVAEMESHVGVLMSYMLWMEKGLTVLEKRLLGPPLGPQ
nr:hypothetical protein [Tanacetum cinerariifolium]